MLAYIFRRLALIVPTLFGIMVVNFIIVLAAPGGPVGHVIAKLQRFQVEAPARVSGSSSGEIPLGATSRQKTGGRPVNK